MDYLTINNDGPEILSSNYWELDMARAGFYYLSLNAGAARLLVPNERELPNMRTAKEIVLSRGPWPDGNKQDAIEVLFDDHTDTPFALWLGLEAVDRVPPDSESGRQLIFSVWGEGPQKLLEQRGYYRRVNRLPCMQPWKPGDTFGPPAT